MDSRDLIETARGLTGLDPRRPTQANPRHAVSTAYYAVFHLLARNAADMLIGRKRGDAWHQVYRALEHGRAYSACVNKQAMQEFSSTIHDFADTFVALQAARHRADYALEGRNYHRLDALAAIDRAEKAIGLLEQANIQDRRGFAAHVLFKRRTS